MLDRKRKILAAMGIQVWYPRTLPARATEEQASAPVEETDSSSDDAATSVQSIEFVWWRGSRGMLFVSPMGNHDDKLLHDLVSALDWRASLRSGDLQTSSVSNGHFKWPQLATTSGDPQRAMSAFLDKFAPAEPDWILVAESLVAELGPLITTNASAAIEELPAVLHDPDEKKSFWQTLAK